MCSDKGPNFINATTPILLEIEGLFGSIRFQILGIIISLELDGEAHESAPSSLNLHPLQMPLHKFPEYRN